MDLGDLVRATARVAVPPDVACSLEIADGIPPLYANHDAVSRAVTNVLLNAVEACAGGGAITLRVAALPPVSTRGATGAPPEVVVAVRDTGIGIAADRLAQIWEPYVTDKVGGTGLGLAIVKQTVLAHGGRVEAESRPMTGTTIRLIFPATTCPPS